jgi:PEP-CTERM motif
MDTQIKKIFLMTVLMVALSMPAYADINFTNGGFENGNLDGWTLGSKTNGGTSYSSAGTGLTTWSPGTNGGTAVQIVSPGIDPNTGIQMTYNNLAARVGDGLAWGYSGGGNQYNWISQTANVTGSTPGNLYFAWASVLQISGHSYLDTPYFEVKVNDLTTGATIYDVLHYEQDSGFWVSNGTWMYSGGNNASYPGWYVESLDLGALGVSVGDAIELMALARDCNPDAHAMYVYLDGFGGVRPPDPTTTPEPCTMLLMGIGAVGIGFMRKRKITVS